MRAERRGGSRGRRYAAALCLLGALAARGGAGALEAQQAGILLRFRPRVGSRVNTVSEYRITSVLVGLPSLPDSTLVETDLWTSSLARVLDQQGPQYIMRLTFDSVRARTRVRSRARVDVPLPGIQRLSLQLRADEQWHRERLEATLGTALDTAFAGLLTAPFAGFEMALPDSALRVDTPRTVRARFPVGALLSAGWGFASTGSAPGTATLRLDSLVPRSADTLVYVTMRGTLGPAEVLVVGTGSEAGTGSASLVGSLAGTLIWSTGWSAFVAGATGVRLEGRFHLERPGGAVDFTMAMTAQGTHQVRL